MANAAYRSNASVANTTASPTFTVAKPSGCVDGDLLTAFQVSSLGGGSNPSTPNGWTLKDTQTFGASKVIQRFEKVAASEGATLTFNQVGGSPVGNETSVYLICTSPGDSASEGGAKTSGTGTTADPGSYTTTHADDLLLVCWACASGLTPTITPDATFTPLGTIGSLSGNRVNVGYKSQAAAGGTADTDAALGESLAWGAMSVAIAPTPVIAPVAAFSGTPTSGEAPLESTFTDASTNTPTSWHWEKDDGNGWVDFDGDPTAQNPTEEFAEGVWDVRLTATNAGGSDDETKLDYITAEAPPESAGRAIHAVLNSRRGVGGSILRRRVCSRL